MVCFSSLYERDIKIGVLLRCYAMNDDDTDSSDEGRPSLADLFGQSSTIGVFRVCI